MNRYQLVDDQYKLYESEDTIIRAFMRQGKLLLNGQDFGKDVERLTGKDEYEYFCELDVRNTSSFITAMKRLHSETTTLKEMLKKEYGFKDGSAKFMKFCDEEKIKYAFQAF